MNETQLSAADKELLFSGRWALNEALRVAKGQGCPPSVSNYIRDAIDVVTEVLDVENPSHVDGDLLPDTQGTPAELKIEEETLDGAKTDPARFKVYAAIGHNAGTGSKSIDGLDEWGTSKLVAERMKQLAPAYGVELMIGIRDRSKGYGDAMRLHGHRSDVFGSQLNLEIHRNAFNGKVTGTEFIVTSDAGSAAGRFFAAATSKFYPSADLRGKEGIRDRREGGRGAGFCRNGKAPAVLTEICFHDVESDWGKIRDDVDREARTYLSAAVAAIMFGTEKVPSLSAAGEFFDQVFPQGALSV